MVPVAQPAYAQIAGRKCLDAARAREESQSSLSCASGTQATLCSFQSSVSLAFLPLAIKSTRPCYDFIQTATICEKPMINLKNGSV